mmetsp:Transcript_74074/g.117789  ORF Transcript_74074/g.117789 Transcript_74074/m.117789 type:complete len:230 (+) Transcript_74074:1031-1720(+)
MLRRHLEEEGGASSVFSTGLLLLQQGDCLHNGFTLLLLVILTKLVLAILGVAFFLGLSLHANHFFAGLLFLIVDALSLDQLHLGLLKQPCFLQNLSLQERQLLLLGLEEAAVGLSLRLFRLIQLGAGLVQLLLDPSQQAHHVSTVGLQALPLQEGAFGANLGQGFVHRARRLSVEVHLLVVLGGFLLPYVGHLVLRVLQILDIAFQGGDARLQGRDRGSEFPKLDEGLL